MDIKKVNKDLMTFWDDFFTKYEPQKITKEDVKVENALDEYIKEVGDYARTILDIGSGTGHCILTAALLGENMIKGIAIDPSTRAIETLSQTLQLSNITNIETIVGTTEDLEVFGDHSFDGILCSNVIDVVPYETSEEMIHEITRLLKPKGLLMLKLNFYLTEDMIKRTKAQKISHNTYAINGILRAYNLTTEEWVQRFSKFRLLKSATYERIKDGPLDRVLLLEKL